MRPRPVLRATVLTIGAWLTIDSSGAAERAMTDNYRWRTLDGAPPLVIAHRGASGYRPEHTLASYALAIEMGADYIEPDLVATKDGRLIARHEPLLDDTTDVRSRPAFASRRSTKVLDGKSVDGFFASDFTLAEIKQLRAVQANPARPKDYDGKYEVPTFDEILDLLARESAKRKRRIGVYPETKHPAFHLALGLPLEERLLEALRRHELDRADAPVFIQSFESANLQYLRTRTRLPLVQLLDDGALVYDDSGAVVRVSIPQYADQRGGEPPQSLADVARYASAIGPWKRQILRNEPATLAPQYGNDPLKEYRQFYDMGVDGVFTDFADTALAARKEADKTRAAKDHKKEAQ
jgi:glycerophosphoryl diester phosphodiesterase